MEFNNNKKHKINEEIRSPEVVLVNSQGKNLGTYSLFDALKMSNDQNLDLVEISPNNSPPICKLLDYGKMIYSSNKKNKKRVVKQDIHTIQLRPFIQDNDLNTKIKKIKEFILQKQQVKVIVLFSGRELSHKQTGFDLLNRVTNQLSNCTKVDKDPVEDIKTISLLLSPK